MIIHECVNHFIFKEKYILLSFYNDMFYLKFKMLQ